MKFLPTVRQMFTYHFHEIIMVPCFEAECNPCSDRETCTFYRFPKYLKNSHDGWQIGLNCYAFVPLAYGMPVYSQHMHQINLTILCHDKCVGNVIAHTPSACICG